MYTLEDQLELEKHYKKHAENLFRGYMQEQKQKGRMYNTDIGQGIVKAMVDTFSKNTEAWLKEILKRKKRGIQPVYKKMLDEIAKELPLDTILLTLCSYTFETVINHVFRPDGKISSISTLAQMIGRHGYNDLKVLVFLERHSGMTSVIEKGLDNRVKVAQKSIYIEDIFKRNKFKFYVPSTKEFCVLGIHLLDMMIESSNLFEYSRGNNKSVSVIATADLVALCNTAEVKLLARANCSIPTIIPPKKWTSLYDGAYYGELAGYHKMIRLRSFLNHTRLQKKYIKKLKEIDLSYIEEALERISNTPYKINRDMLEVITQIVEQGGDMAGIPRTEPYPKLPLLTGDYTKEELKEHKKKAVDLIHKETKRKTKAMRCLSVLSLARDFSKYEVMYFPCNMDFRGRIYPIPPFNPQGDDMTKSLIVFQDPVPVKEEFDLDLLKIQGCNLTGNDKISLTDRIKHIDDHEEEIIASATDPLEYRYWMEADEPLQFLAFCMEYKKALEYIQENGTFIGYKCHIVIAYDGTCSGLQHYSALLHDEVGGSAVNLVDHEVPADIYNEVAQKVRKVVEQDAITGTLDGYQEPNEERLDGKIIYGTKTIARAWLAHGVTRKVCKRPVMTLAYGSGMYGFGEQLYEDITKDNIHFEEISKVSAQYMTRLIWDAVQEVVVCATVGMDFLQALAREMVRENQPVNWWTPLGMPVQQQYLKYTTRSFRTRLGGRMSAPIHYIEVDPHEDLDKIPQKNGIAPNFIHSLDATHLIMTVNEARLRNYTTVHDSFGTSLGEAERLQVVVREQLYKLYTEFKPFENLKKYMEDVIGRPIDIEVPKMGNLDLKEILTSKYVFH